MKAQWMAQAFRTFLDVGSVGIIRHHLRAGLTILVGDAAAISTTATRFVPKND